MNRHQLEWHGLSFRWPDSVRPVLHNVHLTLDTGDFLLIGGPSGAGKSTLLRLLAWLEEPQEGERLFEGRPYAEWGPAGLRAQLGFVQQSPVVTEGSVEDNLLFAFRFRANAQRTPPKPAQLRDALDRLGLAVALTDTAARLSVGQKQRLCLARTCLLEPRLLLLDEPTSALDPDSRERVEHAVEALHRAGTTIVMSTHSEYLPKTPFRKLTVSDGSVREESHV